MLDISSLISDIDKEIKLDKEYNLEYEYFKDSEIIDLGPVKVDGYLYKKYDEIYIKCDVKGVMTLKDSISSENIDYNYNFTFDDIFPENNKTSENTLDILEFLWENIVLEIPIHYTNVEDLSKYQGDGWKVVSEEDIKLDNNPFKELLSDKLGEE